MILSYKLYLILQELYLVILHPHHSILQQKAPGPWYTPIGHPHFLVVKALAWLLLETDYISTSEWQKNMNFSLVINWWCSWSNSKDSFTYTFIVYKRVQARRPLKIRNKSLDNGPSHEKSPIFEWLCFFGIWKSYFT